MENREFTIERTRIMPCTCTHSFQDERYGRSMRVHSLMVKEGKQRGWRCTVCGAVKPL
jgi:hypothetical protein